MATAKEMEELLERELPTLPPLRISRLPTDPRATRSDGIYEMRWGHRTYQFIAEFKARSTPQAVITAAHRAKGHAYSLPGTYPLVIVPYLSPSQLDSIEELGVSAVDLCGNGIINIPHQILVVRSGQPNRFRGSDPLKGVYRGTSSLVARSLVLKRRFRRVTDIREFIHARGGHITLATVSKALRRLAEDLVIERNASGVHVIQPDKLLDNLRDRYRPPRIRARWIGKMPLPTDDLHRELLFAAERVKSRLVLTGISSASHYTVLASEPIAAFYCTARPEDLLRSTEHEHSPTRSFPNVELLQTDAEEVFFDPHHEGGRALSSPVQAWLELATSDKRAQEAGKSLYDRLLTQRDDGDGGR